MLSNFAAIYKSLLLLSVLSVGIRSPGFAADGEGNVDLPRYPSINHDGSEIVFSWRGDLWKVSAEGGAAVRLTSHPANELRSAFSSDGSHIAFESDRDGYQNLYLMTVNGTDIKRLTNTDRSCTLAGFGTDENDNEIITFAGYLQGDVYRAPRPYSVANTGGDLLRIHDAYGRHPIVSPNGERVAFTRGGSSWSRRGYRGSDNREVWVYDRGDETFAQITDWKGNDGKARWVSDKTLIYLSDRENNRANLYRRSADSDEQITIQLTDFDNRDVEDFDISADGSTAVLTAWDTLYTLNLNEPKAEPVALTIRANEDERDNIELQRVNRSVTEAALSPDGRVMAYISYGEVYVRNIEENKPTRRVTRSHAREKQITWSPDGLKLYFVTDRDNTDSIYTATVESTRKEIREQYDTVMNPSKQTTADDDDEETDESGDESDDKNEGEDDNDEDDDDGEDDEDEQADDLPSHLDPTRWRDALTFTIEAVIDAETNDRQPSPSPDGKSLAFRRGRGDIVILNLESGDTRALLEGWDTRVHWRWRPDSKQLAVAKSDLDFNRDIWIFDADGEDEPVNITRHPDNEYNPQWSADGRIISFLSERVNEEYDVWMVYLDKTLDAKSTEQLEEYYEKAAKAAKKRKPLKIEPPTEDKDDENESDDDPEDESDDDEQREKQKTESPELELEDAFRRLRRVTNLPGSEANLAMTPAGDRLVFTGDAGGNGLFSVKWDGSDRKKLRGRASVQMLSLTGKKVVYIAGGQAGTVKTTGGEDKTIAIDDTLTIDLQKQADQKFLEAARIVGENFYHPTLKGLDWAALTDKYHQLALQTRTADEFNYVAARFIGELNGSHLGIRSPGESSPIQQSHGRLGAEYQRIDDGFEVTEIIPESPAATGEMTLQVGDVITAIEQEPFGPNETVGSKLEGRIGKETLLSIHRTTGEGEQQYSHKLKLIVTPISYWAQRGLRYRAYEQRNKKLVAEWSDDRIGYIHIRGMNQSSLDEFERDLYAAAHDRDGLLIDVRNNGGGWTTDRVLASIMVKPHAYTIPRGADPDETGHYPQGRLYIQRYTLPINMLCNEKSFSNAEIISHAFKTLDRGTLIGEETYGGVISTGGTRLIDGTYVRIPFRGWYLPGGVDMENHGAVPDIIVEQTPAAESRNEDEQLKAAVEDLLKRLE